MRKILFFLLFFLIVDFAFTQVDFSGDITPSLIFNVPENDNYSGTPLNPGNQLGMSDILFDNRINLKMTADNDTSGLDFWVQASQYPIADLFLGSAAALQEDEGGDLVAGVGDFFYITDPYVYSFNIMRANVSWNPSDDWNIIFGRQSFLTGYGYGWNPVDLVNPQKNPTDPNADIRGVDALSFVYVPNDWLNIKAYGAFPVNEFTTDYEDILLGGELTFYVPSLEIKLAGLWGGEESGDDFKDGYPNALAGAFFLDIKGVGVYSEVAFRSRSRRNSPNPTGGDTTLIDEARYSTLVGLEYYFSSGISLATEYFYNGEGFDTDQRNDYVQALEVSGGSSGEYLSLYTPTSFSQHYFLTNVNIPWYDEETTFNINAIMALDSLALILTPSVAINLDEEGHLIAEFFYSGFFSFDDSKKNEAWLSPVQHSLTGKLGYYF